MIFHISVTLASSVSVTYYTFLPPSNLYQAMRSNSASVPKKAAFKASRLTPMTFVINEHSDIYDEKPLIYAKVVTQAKNIVILDTGCGGATDDPKIEIKGLRQFIETVPIDENGGEPLNPNGAMRYIVVLSHCHYDHIRTHLPSFLLARSSRTYRHDDIYQSE